MSWQYPPNNNREDDDLGPPPPPFRIRRQGMEMPSLGGLNKFIFFGVAVLVAFIVLNTLKTIYIDWLWFQGVGFEAVFAKRITTQAILFGGGAAIFLVFFGINIYLAARPMLRLPMANASDEEQQMLRRLYQLTIIAATLFFAVVFGAIAASQWDTVLAYLEAVPFGIDDPQFGRDLSYYVFELPALRFFYEWAMGVVVLTALVAAGLYLYRYLTFGVEDGTARQGRIQLILLLALVILLFVFRYWLDRFELNFSTDGRVFGAMYTDINARLPFHYVGMGLGVVTIIALAVAALGRSIYYPMGAMGVWVIAAIIGTAVYPAGLQRFSVDPNELNRERPFIERNIEMTRFAFGLDQMEERPFPAINEVTREEMDANPETVSNLRLLDVDQLRPAYQQLQSIRPLYDFGDVDVDRYEIDGEMRQIMISPRELNPERLPEEAQSWVNQRLQFTHGYGVVMSPVNEIQDGLPRLLMQDIPVIGELELERPEIYYGENDDRYVIVRTDEEEFHYPVEGGNTTTVFEGEGGVNIGSMFRRAIFAWEFQDLNLLISDSLTSESTILFRRNIQQRVREVAPFLTLDYDPYIVVSEGQLFWIQDAYTTTTRIPYSEPQMLRRSGNNVNYIRNSVKIVINAYDGSMTFYLVDEADPIVQTYAKIFPELFTPFEEMPDGLKSHVRYPEELFQAQVDKYLIYHLTDPIARYNEEDVWLIPNEVIGDNRTQPVEPYYVMMSLPGEEGNAEAEFTLILPVTPRQRQNTIAWLAARSDGDNYGQLIAYRFPTNSLVFGPFQVENRIENDSAVASQLGLWVRSGVQVLRGNLLMIPIGEGNLFIEPIYLMGGSNLPELRRVVVVNGNQIAMEPTLEESLAVIFGEAEPTAPTDEDIPDDVEPPPPDPGDPDQPTPEPPPPTPTPTTAPPPTPTPGIPPGLPDDLPDDVAGLVQEASEAYERAQAALQAGDFATYGQEIAIVEQIIQQLVTLTQP